MRSQVHAITSPVKPKSGWCLFCSQVDVTVGQKAATLESAVDDRFKRAARLFLKFKRLKSYSIKVSVVQFDKDI